MRRAVSTRRRRTATMARPSRSRTRRAVRVHGRHPRVRRRGGVPFCRSRGERTYDARPTKPPSSISTSEARSGITISTATTRASMNERTWKMWRGRSGPRRRSRRLPRLRIRVHHRGRRSRYAGMVLQTDRRGGFAARLAHAAPASYPYRLRYPALDVSSRDARVDGGQVRDPVACRACGPRSEYAGEHRHYQQPVSEARSGALSTGHRHCVGQAGPRRVALSGWRREHIRRHQVVLGFGRTAWFRVPGRRGALASVDRRSVARPRRLSRTPARSDHCCGSTAATFRIAKFDRARSFSGCTISASPA